MNSFFFDNTQGIIKKIPYERGQTISGLDMQNNK
jgi:hypothetical protein